MDAVVSALQKGDVSFMNDVEAVRDFLDAGWDANKRHEDYGGTVRTLTLEPAAYCYVNDPGRPAGASHQGGVEAKAAVYGVAHAIYPTARASIRRDNCQDELTRLCGDVPPPPDFRTNATCQKARRAVAEEWRAAFDAGPAPEGYGRAVGVHVRVPEGGAALGHLERYAEKLHDLLAGSNATVVVFGERSGDTIKIVQSLGPRTVVVHEGRSPLDDLRAMAHVGILAVHGSSFSVIASILRAGPAISEHRAPIHGRYAGNTYPCQLGDSWWWSPGFGRDDCPEGGFFKRPARGDGGDGVR
ncbi:unnamed protein product [Pelagomonas calceolata]|uniref:Uncharacterized protein n=1 Tax=Pelagomonas calceolata TaxID=35677 RepID=A0A8J2S2L1_9STRA|nr:unnamed protein product [Pelagomonas calceolata]